MKIAITLGLRQHPKKLYTPWAGVQTWERADEETCGSTTSREVPVVLFWNLLGKFALKNRSHQTIACSLVYHLFSKLGARMVFAFLTSWKKIGYFSICKIMQNITRNKNFSVHKVLLEHCYTRSCVECGCFSLQGQLIVTDWPNGRRRQWHPLQYSCLENPMDGGAW